MRRLPRSGALYEDTEEGMKASDEDGVCDIDNDNEYSYVGLSHRSRVALTNRRRGRTASI